MKEGQCERNLPQTGLVQQNPSPLWRFLPFLGRQPAEDFLLRTHDETEIAMAPTRRRRQRGKQCRERMAQGDADRADDCCWRKVLFGEEAPDSEHFDCSFLPILAATLPPLPLSCVLSCLLLWIFKLTQLVACPIFGHSPMHRIFLKKERRAKTSRLGTAQFCTVQSSPVTSPEVHRAYETTVGPVLGKTVSTCTVGSQGL